MRQICKMNSSIFFHIGFPKTATTTLQDILLRHRDCLYIGKGLRERMVDNITRDITKYLVFSTFSQSKLMAETLKSCLYKEQKGESCIFISDEAYTFAEFMLIGDRWQRQVVSDHWEMARKMHAICPDAQIIVTLRAQMDFLKSYYIQQSRFPDFKLSFFEFIDKEIQSIDYHSMLHLLQYDQCIEVYRSFFGSENVHIYFYEEVRVDYEEYLKKIMETIGIDTDEAIRLWGGQRLNERRVRTKLDFLSRQLPPGVRALIPRPAVEFMRKLLAVRDSEPVAWDPGQHDFCCNYFRDSNRRLAAMTGVDVAGLGYAT
jgi:hypothetical protein